jgi:hypothetical protein
MLLDEDWVHSFTVFTFVFVLVSPLIWIPIGIATRRRRARKQGTNKPTPPRPDG